MLSIKLKTGEEIRLDAELGGESVVIHVKLRRDGKGLVVDAPSAVGLSRVAPTVGRQKIQDAVVRVKNELAWCGHRRRFVRQAAALRPREEAACGS